ncbi:MAG: response regulator [Planctomycetota bacterium]
MNIKVHTSLVLLTCTFAGLIFGGLLIDRFRSIDVATAQIGPRSVAMRTASILVDDVGEWLTVIDMILVADQSSLLNRSGEKCDRLRGLITELEQTDLAAGSAPQLAGIRRKIGIIERRVFDSRTAVGPERREALAALHAGVQPSTKTLVASVTDLRDALQQRADYSATALREQEESLTALISLFTLLYFGIVWLCWIWTVHRVVVPIEGLSAAAERAETDEQAFTLAATGPAEVQQLSRNISNFARKLQGAKASTEQKVRERTEELVQANQAKGQFLATMSHELRTPLNGIINMNELMLDTQLEQDQQSYARTAKNAAEALLALINDILDFSKIEARKLELEEVLFDLRELVDSTVEMLTGVAESKSLELAAVVDAGVPQRMVGDPTRLRQVIINLLNNALKFTSQGNVSVFVTLTARETFHAVLQVEVRDTGIGIPEDRRKSLFTAFEQVDSSTTRKYGGTGLGLAISRELVALMDGTIAVDSVEGDGSTFRFHARLGLASDETADSREDANGVPAELPTVLIISNRPIVVQRIEQQLLFLGAKPERIRQLAPRIGTGNSGSGVSVSTDCDSADGELAKALRDEACFVIYDPYSPTSSDNSNAPSDSSSEKPSGIGFTALAQVRELVASLPSRIAILDHWMRRWPEDFGDAPHDCAALLEPTQPSALRSWLTQKQEPHAAPPERLTQPAASTPRVAPAQEPDAPSTEHDGKRILVVEDTPVNQRVVCTILQRTGFDVTLADNGLEAVRRCESDEFDLILMDCQMPVMDGLEATRCIRAMELERTASSALPRQVPIIALTANAQAGFDEECIAAGMDHFLSKPCRAASLLEAITLFLEWPERKPTASEPITRRVLVADDDAINRTVAVSVLKRAGYTIDLAENGEQAVAQCREHSYDIVLMDCQMPVLDGLSASVQIRQLESQGDLPTGTPAHLPIVALTGNVQDSDRQAAEDAGMDEFLSKPFRPHQLVDLVRRLTGTPE